MILVEHRCGFITQHRSVTCAGDELREIYGPGTQVDRDRSLVWAEGEGLPVAEIRRAS